MGLETYLFSGCVPRDDAMVPFADFIAFLAARRAPAAVPSQGAPDQAASPAGRISHFIIWNEVRVWAPHLRLMKESVQRLQRKYLTGTPSGRPGVLCAHWKRRLGWE